jgi:Periplasmic binding protein
MIGAFCALSIVIAACGRDATTTPAVEEAPVVATAAPAVAASEPAPAGEPADSPAPVTDAPPVTDADPCAGVTLEATDTGISADTITVLVMADVGSELAPGLFQGSIDGTKAWAKAVNAAGGLGCRQVEVIEWDSKISATESTNGFLEACAKAVAMVGSTSLFIGDVGIIETCEDATGAPTGIADVPQQAVDAIHQCSTHVFTVAGVAGTCPYSGEGPRDYDIVAGPTRKYAEIAGEPLHGIFLIPSDLPAIIASSMPVIRGLNQEGLIVSDGEFGVSGRAEQATYAEYVATMKTAGSNVVLNNSNDQVMIKMRTEAKAQGLDESKVLWACPLSCYTESFAKDPNVEGTYVWLPFVPFEERDESPEAATFLDAIGQDFPQAWSVGAWNSGRAFEQAVNTIVATDGPNAITRASVLSEMGKITDFTSNGWIGTVDLSQKGYSSCFVIVQLKGGKFERVFPTEVGTLDCTETNLATWTGDALAEFKG